MDETVFGRASEEPTGSGTEKARTGAKQTKLDNRARGLAHRAHSRVLQAEARRGKPALPRIEDAREDGGVMGGYRCENCKKKIRKKTIYRDRDGNILCSECVEKMPLFEGTVEWL